MGITLVGGHTKKKIVLFSIVAAIVILILGWLITYPIIKGIVDDHTEILLQKEDLALITADTKNVEQFQRSFTIYEAELTRLSTLFIDPITPIEFIEFLEQLAESHSMDLSVLLGNPRTVAGDPWPSLNFTIDLEGSYVDTLRVLEKIESSSYLVELKSVQIITRRTIPSDRDVKSSVVLKVYTKEIPELE